MYFLTIFVSEALSSMVPDASRMNFVVRLIMPWRLPATPAFARPEAVKLKRFFAADLVFILGISISVAVSYTHLDVYKRQPEPTADMVAVEQALRQFDGAGRLIRWPGRTSQQKLALWALWSRLPKGETLTERQISERLNHWHLFGDAAIIRRTLWEMGLISRSEGRDYLRIEQAPDPTARALIRAVTARRG